MIHLGAKRKNPTTKENSTGPSFITTKPALKELLRGCLRWKRKSHNLEVRKLDKVQFSLVKYSKGRKIQSLLMIV